MERAAVVGVGAIERAGAKLSDLARALLDAAARPDLTGGAAVLADALVTAGSRIDPQRLTSYASWLRWRFGRYFDEILWAAEDLL